MDTVSFDRYNKENQDIIDLALKVNSKAGKAIKIMKTTAQANVQNENQEAQKRDKSVRVRSELRLRVEELLENGLLPTDMIVLQVQAVKV